MLLTGPADALPCARPLVPARLPEVMPPGARAIRDVAPGACRWPLGEVGEAGFRFCGAARVKGSYCALHAPLSRRPRRGGRGR